MDQLTQLYKSRAQDLQRKVYILEEQLKNLSEAEEVKWQERSDGTWVKIVDGKAVSLHKNRDGEEISSTTGPGGQIIPSVSTSKGDEPKGPPSPYAMAGRSLVQGASSLAQGVSELVPGGWYTVGGVGAVLGAPLIRKLGSGVGGLAKDILTAPYTAYNVGKDVLTGEPAKAHTRAIERDVAATTTAQAQAGTAQTQQQIADVQARFAQTALPDKLTQEAEAAKEAAARAQKQTFKAGEAKVGERVATSTEPHILTKAAAEASTASAEQQLKLMELERQASAQRALGKPGVWDPRTGQLTFIDTAVTPARGYSAKGERLFSGAPAIESTPSAPLKGGDVLPSIRNIGSTVRGLRIGPFGAQLAGEAIGSLIQKPLEDVGATDVVAKGIMSAIPEPSAEDSEAAEIRKRAQEMAQQMKDTPGMFTGDGLPIQSKLRLGMPGFGSVSNRQKEEQIFKMAKELAKQK